MAPDLPEHLDRYRILDLLGRGAMGEVYLALDPKFDRRIALKVMSASRSGVDDPLADLRPRFVHEALAAGRLNHPDIVTIYDAGTDRATGRPFIAMEWVDGESLRVRLRRRGPIPVDDAVTMVARVARALDYAHRQGVVHRDVKPANLLIRHDDLRPKIADFGVAKLVASSLTLPGQILGSPNYMSPEQVKSEPVDGRADLFALGAVLYECLAGRPPFAADSLAGITYKVVNVDPRPIRMHNADVPDTLALLIDQMLAKSPYERPASGLEVADALDPRRGSSVGAQVAPQVSTRRSLLPSPPGNAAAVDSSDRDGPQETEDLQPRPAAKTHRGRIDPRRLTRSVVTLLVATFVGFFAAHWWLAPPSPEELAQLTRHLGIFEAPSGASRSDELPTESPTADGIPLGETEDGETEDGEFPADETTMPDGAAPETDVPTGGAPTGEAVDDDAGADDARAEPEAEREDHTESPLPAPEPDPEAAAGSTDDADTSQEPDTVQAVEQDGLPAMDLPPSRVLLTVKHRFKLAYLSIWVDGKKMLTKPLTRDTGLERWTGRTFSLTLALSPGERQVEAHISGLSTPYEGRGDIIGKLRPGQEVELDIRVQRRPDGLDLRWRQER